MGDHPSRLRKLALYASVVALAAAPIVGGASTAGATTGNPQQTTGSIQTASQAVNASSYKAAATEREIIPAGFLIRFATGRKMCMASKSATPRSGTPVVMQLCEHVANTPQGRWRLLSLGRLANYSTKKTHPSWLQAHATWTVYTIQNLASTALCLSVPTQHNPPPGVDDAFLAECAKLLKQGDKIQIKGVVFVWNGKNQLFPFFGDLTVLNIWPAPGIFAPGGVPWCLEGSTVAGENVVVESPGLPHQQFSAVRVLPIPLAPPK